MPKRRRYEIVVLDIDRPFAGLRIDSRTDGVAIEFRRGNRPVGFVMQPLRPETAITGEMLQAWLDTLPAADRDQDICGLMIRGHMPTVTIAICTKDHPNLLRRCLQGILVLRIDPADTQPEILVVDNASTTAETCDVAASHPSVRYVREPRPGLNFARNRALAEARGDILAFIDDDAVIDQQWLAGLRQAWSREPEAGAFSGQTLPFELETEAQIIVEEMGGFRKGFRPIVFRQTSESDPLYPCTTVFGNGCNMAFRVDVMRLIGGFDEALDMGAYLPGGGDLDALYRIIRAGCPLVYEPQMLARHQHRRDMEGLRRQIRRSWGAGCMAYLTKIRDRDSEMREKAKLFINWWMKNLLRRVILIHDTPEQPWPLAVQEFVGAVTGLAGTYERSARRCAKIRQQVDGG